MRNFVALAALLLSASAVRAEPAAELIGAAAKQMNSSSSATEQQRFDLLLTQSAMRFIGDLQLSAIVGRSHPVAVAELRRHSVARPCPVVRPLLRLGNITPSRS